MSRTYKDMPRRVRLQRDRGFVAADRIVEFHVCVPQNNSGGTYRPCDIDQSMDHAHYHHSYQHCHPAYVRDTYYEKPDYRGAVRDKMNKPLRNRERAFTTSVIKDHRAGIDNPGGDRDILIPRPTKDGPLGGGYWH